MLKITYHLFIHKGHCFDITLLFYHSNQIDGGSWILFQSNGQISYGRIETDVSSKKQNLHYSKKKN